MIDDVFSMFRPNVLRMKPYVPGEQPKPGEAIKLNTNENPYPPSPAVIKAIQEATSCLQTYPDPLATTFRIQAADVLGVDPDQILCGNGSDDILTILTRAFLKPGGKIRFPYPSYILYRTLADLQDGTSEEISFESDWSLSEEMFRYSSDLGLVYLPNPNSPTGTMVSREEIVRLAESLPCPVVVDEAYVDFAPYSCVDLPAKYPNILVTRTLSKSYALAGLRFGYVVGNHEVISTLRKVKDSYNTDRLSIAGATAAIRDQAWLAENVRKCNSTREELTQQLRSLGFAVIDSSANFVWARRNDAPSEPIYQFLKANGILVRYMNYPEWQDGLRISVGTADAISKLIELLNSYLNASVKVAT